MHTKFCVYSIIYNKGVNKLQERKHTNFILAAISREGKRTEGREGVDVGRNYTSNF